MDERYDSYCAADPLFYDSLGSAVAQPTFAAASRPLPTGWRRESLDDWLIHAPDGERLPQQGWKVHVSATVANADRVLDAVWDYCVPRGLSFKFLRGPRTLLLRNSKYAARAASGKFVTVYPRDDAELELVCKELDELLSGEAGPYILSDLRYAAGPVYVRYGGFAARYCHSPDGQVVPAVEDDTGTLVPDRRDPVFHVPSWVTLPDFLAPHLAARNATSTDEVPYRIEKVIHFSNGGGLYVGRDGRTDTQLVFKEARPHAGLDADGTDAVTRLAREAAVLRQLADLPQVPRVHDEFALSDHRFLALEFIEGRPLNKVLVDRYPLIDADATDEDRAAYASWALDVHRQVDEVVRAIHARGLVYGDLHLFNIMLRPDDRVALVDFEVAAPIDGHRRPGLRNQGFAAPRGRTGVAVDHYALACLRLALFLPLTQLVRLVPAKAAHLADIIADTFPVPRDFLDAAVAEITAADAESGDRVPPTADVPPVDRDRLARAILTSATPARTDRLFPGDIEQFRSGGLNLAHGAAGVLYALHQGGAGRWPEHEQWLVRQATSPPSGTRCGFYDGLHGVAYALEVLGRRQDALDVLDICLRESTTGLDHSLAGGLAGIALNLAELGGRTGEPALREAAWQVTGELVERLADDPGGDVSGGRHPYAGLLRGRTGAALLLVRLYELTGDPDLLDHAATALRQDLRRCVVRPDGALEVNEGWRTMPYLGQGSVGIGLVLDQYLRHRSDEQFAEASAGVRRAARSPFYAQSGLFAGRAGIIAYLAAQPGDPELRGELDRQIRRLGWHALPYRDGTAFPGEQLLRLSMDLATGTAGVLLALATARPDAPTTLPFLAPLTGAPDSPATAGATLTPTPDRR
ncbi:class III lanthionine synthetase LanKC [Micromonospora sediminimaris]|uniref:Serine/threonine protein kinase n=1 Tax=Micromonospora sediminimaris TaxID=547162 RepID=A0A9W5UNM1_9ACTN|nr:class III lanthionine synthetase LanKC [Micromonospora sediminimaris]GIJ32782.1 serine/threonine protein kinase [Micromonospora sediminimaris]SFD06948.1 Protein kinase domain-containing protein [Micromonospora sediminimaris]